MNRRKLRPRQQRTRTYRSKHKPSARKSGGHYYDELRPSLHDAVLAEDLPRQVRDRPKEEQDRDGRKQGAHNVNHKSYLRRVACEARKDATRQHKERCAGRVSHVELRSGGDKFGAIPESSPTALP